MEQSEREMREQLNHMKGKVAEVEGKTKNELIISTESLSCSGDNHRLANSLKQKEIELVDIRKVIEFIFHFD